MAAVLGLAAVTLTGCGATAGFSDLDQEDTTKIELPAVSEEALPESADGSTARLVGDYRGADVWLLKNAQDGACLVVYPDGDPDDWYSSCVERSAEFALTIGTLGEFVVLPDGHTSDRSQELTQISLNVYAVE